MSQCSSSLPEPRLVHSLRGHSGTVISVAFNPAISFCTDRNSLCGIDENEDGGNVSCLLIPGAADNNTNSRKVDYRHRDVEKSDDSVYTSRQSRRPDQQIASSASDGSIMLWNIHKGRKFGNQVSSSQEPKDSGKVGRAEEDRVRAYRLIGHQGPVHRISYSPSGKLLASCSSDNTVRLWAPSQNYSKGGSILLKGHSGNVRCVDFGPSWGVDSFRNNSNEGSYDNLASNDNESSAIGMESLLLTCSDDKTLKLWSLPQTTFRTSFIGHTNWVRVAKFAKGFSKENLHKWTQLAASGGDDKTVRVWDCNHSKNLATYDFFRGAGDGSGQNGNSAARSLGGVRDLDFLPSGMALAACGTDGAIRVYDLRCDSVVQQMDCTSQDSGTARGSTPKKKNDTRGGVPTVDSLSVHPNGINVLSATCYSAEMWDLRYPQRRIFEVPVLSSIGKSGRSVASPHRSPNSKNRSATNGIPSTAAFSSDGSHFALSLRDSAVRVYKWKGGASAAESVQNDNGIGVCAISNKENDQCCAGTDVVTNDLVPQTHQERNDVQTTSEDLRCLPNEKVTMENNQPSFRHNFAEHTHNNHIPPSTVTTSIAGPCDMSSWKYNKENLPEILSATLDRVVGQLDMLAQTVIMLEQRLSVQESSMARLQLQQQQIFEMCRNGNIVSSKKAKETQQEQVKDGIRQQEVEPHPFPEKQRHNEYHMYYELEENLKTSHNHIPLKQNDRSQDKSIPSHTTFTHCSAANDLESDISTVVDKKVESVLRRHLSPSKDTEIA